MQRSGEKNVGVSPDVRKRLSYNYTKNSLQRINKSLSNVDANYYSRDIGSAPNFNSSEQADSSLRLPAKGGKPPKPNANLQIVQEIEKF